MRDFVQYHNPDQYGQFDPSEKEFRIFTRKSVDDLVGNRVWLVSRRGDPPEYILCMTFVAERVDEGPPLKYFAEASQGRMFDPPVRIDHEPWFERLRKVTGNFHFGPQPINDEEVVQGLLKIASQS